MKVLFFVVLVAWTPGGMPTSDSGVRAFAELRDCHNSSLKFSKDNNTVIQLCKKISKSKYDIIAKQHATFDFNLKQYVKINDTPSEEVLRLRAALKEIGKWHRGKTKDSKRVRAIIRRVLK